MVIKYFNRVIEKKYPFFDNEEQGNVFVSYMLNLVLILFNIPWIFIFHGYNYIDLSYLYIGLAICFSLVLLLIIELPVPFKIYRFILTVMTLLTVGITSISLGKFSASIYSFYIIPMGMIMVFSRKERKVFLLYLLFILSVSFCFIYYTYNSPPIVELSPEILEATNFNDIINTTILTSVLAYLYWSRNAVLQSLLVSERAKSDNLLLSIFPEKIAQSLKGKKGKVVDGFENVTVLFADIVNFTQYSETIKPQELVDMLDKIFSALDKLADQHNVEKIKTIGDAYMAVSGLPIETPKHCQNIADFALAVNKMAKEKFAEKYNLQFRMGIHTGRVIAGVIGENKLSYDLWGLTVNTASRYESHGKPGKIHITKEVKDKLATRYKIKYNGEILIKGLGIRKSYFLESN